MAEKRITRIPATPTPPKRTRTVAYARVSCGKDAMLHSLSAQVSHYSAMIQNKPEWEYVGVYADEALTGTKDNRPQLQKLLADCRAGLIDQVLVKSVSRLARNTVTLLEIVREFRLLGVDIYFEREGIHTMSAEGELMLTLIASIAQEESLSVSQNCKWRIQKQFEAGELATLRFLFGYRIYRGQIGIVPEEADVVRSIFADYIRGIGATDIAKRLQTDGVSTPRGGAWTANRVRNVLQNEKYTGNALLQKKYVEDHLSKRRAINHGQLPMYYVADSHEAVIDIETFEAAKAITALNGKRFKAGETPQVRHPFTSLITCGGCGKHYVRKQNKGRAIWHCCTYMRSGKVACPAKAVPEDVLTTAGYATLGSNNHSLDALHNLVERIIVPEQGRVVFELRNGQHVEHTWEHKSRRESWDEAARLQAREHARKRYTK